MNIAFITFSAKDRESIGVFQILFLTVAEKDNKNKHILVCFNDQKEIIYALLNNLISIFKKLILQKKHSLTLFKYNI